MAREYFDKLSRLVDELKIEEELSLPVEVKHFFSGAALYANGTMCASWSPVGLAFKLPDQEAEALIAKGDAMPLKYFPKGHVKKGYALFENPEGGSSSEWREYFMEATRQTCVDEHY